MKNKNSALYIKEKQLSVSEKKAFFSNDCIL